jgi:hypothetical protein
VRGLTWPPECSRGGGRLLFAFCVFFFSDAHRSDLARKKIAGFVCLNRIWRNRQEIVDMVRRLDEIVQRLDSNGSRRKTSSTVTNKEPPVLPSNTLI